LCFVWGVVFCLVEIFFFFLVVFFFLFFFLWGGGFSFTVSIFLLQYFDTVLLVGSLTCKNRLPYNGITYTVLAGT